MGKFKDLTGQKFGKLTVLRRAGIGKSGHYDWWCVCDCTPDKEILVSGKNLRNGCTRSCGCLARESRIGRKMKKRSSSFKDLIGQRFGKLVVVSCAGKDRHGKYHWWCVCDCTPFKIKRVDGASLKRGHTISCGCHQKEVLGKSRITHGMSNTRFYRIWREMKGRCTNPNLPNYKYYGGRGIKICDRWEDSFENFRDDMYESYQKHVEEYGEKNTTLDRIDVNSDYCSENCRWATWNEQANNHSTCIKLTYKGETHTMSEWASILGIKRKTIFSRYYKGYVVEDVLATHHLQKPKKSIIILEVNNEEQSNKQQAFNRE